MKQPRNKKQPKATPLDSNAAKSSGGKIKQFFKSVKKKKSPEPVKPVKKSGGKISQFFTPKRKKKSPQPAKHVKKSSGGKIGQFFKPVKRKKKPLPPPAKPSQSKIAELLREQDRRQRDKQKAAAEFRQARKQALREERWKRQQLKLIRGFKPGPRDKGKIVFLGLDGRRKGPEFKGKGYAFFVNEFGGVEPYNETLKPIQQSTVKPERFNAGDGTVKEWYDRHYNVSAKSVDSGSVHNKKGISFWADVCPLIAFDLERAVMDEPKVNRTYLVDTISLLPDGEVVRASYNFNQRANQFLREGSYLDFTQIALYAQFAERLALMGYVTSGSARYVQMLPENKNTPRKQWSKMGRPWNKKNKKIWDIVHTDWKITRIRIVK